LWLNVHVYQLLSRLKSISSEQQQTEVYLIRTAADSILSQKNNSTLDSIALEQQQGEIYRSRTTAA
jgi:hypothetical protein